MFHACGGELGMFTLMCPVLCALALVMVRGGLAGPSTWSEWISCVPFCTHVPIFSAPTWFRKLITDSIPPLVRTAQWTWGLRRELAGQVPTWTSSTLRPHQVMLSFCTILGADCLSWHMAGWPLEIRKMPQFQDSSFWGKAVEAHRSWAFSRDWSGDKFTSYVNWKMIGMNGWGGRKALRNPGPVLTRAVEMVTAHWQDWSSGKIPGVGGTGSPAFSWRPAGICAQSCRNGKAYFCGPQSHKARFGVVDLEKLQRLEHGLPHIHGFKCRDFHCPISLCHWRETTVEERSAHRPTDEKFVLDPYLTVEVICMQVDLQSEGCVGYIPPTRYRTPNKQKQAGQLCSQIQHQSLWLQHFRNMGEPKSWKCARENETPIKNVGDLSKNLEWM